MPVYRFDGQSPNAHVRSWSYTSHTWPAARDKTESSQSLSHGYFGAYYNGTYYEAYQHFLQFDTSTIPDDETVVRAVLAPMTYATGPAAAQTVLAYAYDWGGSVSTANWRTRAQLQALPLFASISGADVNGWNGVLQNMDPASGSAALVNKTGYTRLVIVSSDNLRADDDPPNEYSSKLGLAYDDYYNHHLVVVTEPATEDTPQIAPWGHRGSGMVSLPSAAGVFGVPGAAPGDVGLIVAAYNATMVPSTPDGWTVIEDARGVSSGHASIIAWYKVLDAADVHKTRHGPTSVPYGGAATFVTNVDPSSPLGDSSRYIHAAPCLNPVSIPSVDQSASRAVLVAASSHQTSADNVVGSWSCETDNPSSWGDHGDNNISAGVISSVIGYGLRVGKTSTGAITAAYTGSTTGVTEAGLAFFVNGTAGFEWTTRSIVINSGAASTDDNDVTLTLNAAATLEGSPVTVDKMRFSEDGETWGEWENYATSRAYQLPPQDDEDPHTCTVYVQFRVTEGGTDYDSEAVSDSITLQIDWTLVQLRINGGAPATFDLDVSCRFRGFSSASSLSNGIPSSYRIRETDGAWSGWATFTPDRTHRNRGWMTVPFAFAHASEHTVEVMLRDDDLNTITTTASIDVIGVADSLGGAAAPVDITNWRLQLGTTIDVIDALDAPPKFNLGEHGPGSLQASIPVEHPLRRWANELSAGEDVKLWDGTLLLWDGKLKPAMPVSGEESTLIIDAAGPLDLGKQDASYLATFVDADPSHWTVSAKASKAFGCDTEGGPSIKHTKGRGVEGGKGAGIWYWVNGGKKNVPIDHVEFSAASSIDVGATNWYARFQVAQSPWSAWTTVKEWNNVTVENTAIRIPTTGSFVQAGYANVYAVKILLISSNDVSAADSTHTRWVDLADPQVFVNVEAEPSVDEALAYIANELGYADQVVEAVGTDLSSLAFLDPTTRSAAMEQVALMHPGEVEWYWRGGIFYCRPKPTAPDDRTRWYVIDSRRCEWGVVSDEARRVDYVAVTYQIKGHATIPQGTPQILYRPSTPTDPTARVGTLDMTENGPMTTSAAQDAGDQWLRWNDAQAKSGPISGFGGSLRTVDGLWVPACHARNGDWIQPLDLFDVGPLYITAVEVNGIEDVVLNVGGSEREYAYRPRVFNWRRPNGPRKPHLPPHPRRQGGRTTDG